MARDDDFHDVIEEVLESLESFDLDDNSRDALSDGIREGLREAFRLADRPSGRPHVTVLPGGRGAPGPVGLDDDDDDDDDEDDVEPRADVRVRVIRPGSSGLTQVPLAEEGQIRVRGQADGAPGDWQTVYRGDMSCPYRLLCRAGTLEVSFEGVEIERLQFGQSMDVNARMIRVRTADEVALGAYTRLA